MMGQWLHNEIQERAIGHVNGFSLDSIKDRDSKHRRLNWASSQKSSAKCADKIKSDLECKTKFLYSIGSKPRQMRNDNL